MSLKVNNPGDRRQVLDTLAGDHIQTRHEQYTRCSRCNRFGVVSDTHGYYGIIYKCIRAVNREFFLATPRDESMFGCGWSLTELLNEFSGRYDG